MWFCRRGVGMGGGWMWVSMWVGVEGLWGDCGCGRNLCGGLLRRGGSPLPHRTQPPHTAHGLPPLQGPQPPLMGFCPPCRAQGPLKGLLPSPWRPEPPAEATVLPTGPTAPPPSPHTRATEKFLSPRIMDEGFGMEPGTCPYGALKIPGW